MNTTIYKEDVRVILTEPKPLTPQKSIGAPSGGVGQFKKATPKKPAFGGGNFSRNKIARTAALTKASPSSLTMGKNSNPQNASIGAKQLLELKEQVPD